MDTNVEMLVADLETMRERAGAIIAATKMLQDTAAYMQAHHLALRVDLDIDRRCGPLDVHITLRLYPDLDYGAPDGDDAGPRLGPIGPDFGAMVVTDDELGVPDELVSEIEEVLADSSAAVVACDVQSDAIVFVPAPEADPESAPSPAPAPVPETPPKFSLPARWTAADDLLLLSAKVKGAPRAALAERLGRAMTACDARVKELRSRGVTLGSLRAIVPGGVEWGDPPPLPAPAAVVAEAAPEQVPAAARAPDPGYAVNLAPPPEPLPGLSTADRRVAWRLQRLMGRDGWTAALDQDLVARLSKGEKLHAIAADLGLDSKACRDRFAALVPEPGMEAQAQVLRVLASLQQQAA